MPFAITIPRLDELGVETDIDKDTLLNLLYQRSLFVDEINHIHETAIIGDGAILTGDVRVGPNSVIFYGTMLQADKASIVIGEGCLIVDGVLMHNKVKIGDFVHIAHGCIIHRRRSTGCLKIGCLITCSYFFT